MKHTLLFLTLLLTGLSNAQTVTIGTQVWMTKNLDVSTFRNGDPIPEAKTDEEWKKAGDNRQPAWCYYNNDPANGAKYGKLYNWYAVNDPRGLAPSGYHIPSHAEWYKLTDFLGGEADAGIKMKSTSGWDVYSQPGQPKWMDSTNTSGFSGLPGGNRNQAGSFNFIGKFGNWWSSSDINAPYSTEAFFRYLGFSSGDVTSHYTNKGKGFSVRCLRD